MPAMPTKSSGGIAGSIPDVYDEHVVPLMFQTFADDLADRVSTINPKSVLEVAAGSGVATRWTRRRLTQPVPSRTCRHRRRRDRIRGFVIAAR